jgi:RND family efflux transporter MFP subunit
MIGRRPGGGPAGAPVAGTWGPLATLLLTALLAAGCGQGEHGTQAAPQGTPVAVTTAVAAMSERPDLFEAGGTVRGRASATLASRVMATVQAVLVQPGDRVRAGQPLVLLDDRDVAAAARQARARATAAARALDASHAEQASADAALTFARATHGRIAALYERKSATAQEFDQAVASLRSAETRVVRAKAGIDEIHASLEAARAGGDAADVTASFARVVAPFAGLVTEKLVEPGNLAAPGTPLLRLEDTQSLELEIRIDESRAAWVTSDLPVSVVVDGTHGRLDLAGRVVEIARAIDADSRAFLVTIALPAAETLRPGMFGRAYLPGPTRSALWIPDGALVRRGQLTSVFVVDRDKAHLRLVNAGRSRSAQTEVLAGLSAGEVVVIAPPPGLRDGAALAVRNTTPSASAGGRS